MTFRKRLLNGTLWASSGSFVARGLQLLSSIYLTRLIAPNEYGLVAISATINGIAEQTTAFFLETALVQKSGDIDDYIHTVWVFNIFRYSILFTAIYFAAPWLAEFFHDPTATAIIRTSAFSFIVVGFRNVGIIHYRRSLQFDKLFVVDVYPLFVYIVSALALGWLWRNAWAFVISSLISSIAALILSFYIKPLMPRFTFNKARFFELFGFGKWIIIKSFVAMIKTNGFNMFVGRFFDIVTLGYFNRGQAFSTNIFTQITDITWKVLFPAFSSVNQQKEQTRRLLIMSLKLILFVSLPVIVGFASISEEFVLSILTRVWLPIVPIITLLCVLAAVQVINIIPGIVLDALGYPKYNSAVTIVEAVSIVVCIYPFSYFWGINGAIIALCLGQIILMPLLYKRLFSFIPFSLQELITIPLFSLTTTTGLYFSLKFYKNVFSMPVSGRQLTMEILFGAAAYILVSFISDIVFRYDLRSNVAAVVQTFRKQRVQ